MKNKKILFPILGATSIVSVTTPFILTGCNNKQTFELNNYDPGSGQLDEGVFYTLDVDLNANKWYIAKIDMSNSPKERDLTKSLWWFTIATDFPYVESTANITDAKVWIDGKRLTKIDFNPDDPEPTIAKDEFMLINIPSDTENLSWLVGGQGSLTNSSKIKIEFKINETIKDSCLFFQFDRP